MKIIIAIIALYAIPASAIGQGKRYFVNVNVVVSSLATGLPGRSWQMAFPTLQEALEEADDGDEIWVAQGTYGPTKDKNGSLNPADSKTKTFYIDKNITIYGGFDATEFLLSERDRSTHPTILAGGDSIYQIVHIDDASQAISDDCVLDGFIIEEGNANGAVPYHIGGAILIDGSTNGASPVIRNCIFRDNFGKSGGGRYFIMEGLANHLLLLYNAFFMITILIEGVLFIIVGVAMAKRVLPRSLIVISLIIRLMPLSMMVDSVVKVILI